MNRPINAIMLVDDNKIDNFFHERVIKKYNPEITVIVRETGQDAIDYLTGDGMPLLPNLIFLDINMPGMNGWEFIEHYKQLDRELHTSIIVVMLTTSQNNEDILLAKSHNIIADFKSKPLTIEGLKEIIDNHTSGK